MSVDDLRLEPGPDGARHGNIEVMPVAYNPEGEPLNLAVSRSEIRIPVKDYANVQSGGLPIHKEIDIPRSDAYLRTGIYDSKSASAN